MSKYTNALTVATMAIASSLWGSGEPVTTKGGASAPSPKIQISIPRMLTYQGKLTDQTGLPVKDSTYSMTFKLYSEPSGGTPIWTETQPCSTSAGLFNCLLGSYVEIESLPSSGSCYLQMQVNPDPPMTQRVQIVSSGYAFYANKADTANYSLSGSDSARVAANAHRFQGKDTTAFAAVNHTHTAIGDVTGTVSGSLTIASNAVTTTKIADTAVTMAKLAPSGATTGQVLKWTGTRWWPGNDSIGGGGGSGTVTSISESTGITCNPNPITANGRIGFDQSWGDSRYVNEGQPNSITGTMIQTNTIARSHVVPGFKAPFADTSDYARAAPAVDSARVAADAYKLEGNDTTALDGRYVNEGQSASGDLTGAYPSPTIAQKGATLGQVLKWNGSAWQPRNDSVGGGDSARIAANSWKLDGVDTSAFAKAGHNHLGETWTSAVNLGLGLHPNTTSSSEVDALVAQADNTGSGDLYGGKFSAISGSGTGIRYGVYGAGSTFASTSNSAYGVFGSSWQSSSASGGSIGVCGNASRGSSGLSFGGSFSASGSGTLTGAYGYASSGTGSVGVQGQTQGGSGSCGVYYSGGLNGSGSKNCVVRTSKGPTLLYCQESPECWFEDFGGSKLVSGSCHVELDKLFLETVVISDAHPMKIFVQLEDDCNGVYVKRGTTGFDVFELQNGRSNASFSYRVVAKRKGFETERLKVSQIGYLDPYLYPNPNDPEIPTTMRQLRLEKDALVRQMTLDRGTGAQDSQHQESTLGSGASSNSR